MAFLDRFRSSRAPHALFAVLGLGLVVFLVFAPDETTSHLPRNETHLPFYAIKSKKEAEKQCITCHRVNGEAPLPEDHPPPYRCLFCHKREL